LLFSFEDKARQHATNIATFQYHAFQKYYLVSICQEWNLKFKVVSPQYKILSSCLGFVWPQLSSSCRNALKRVLRSVTVFFLFNEVISISVTLIRPARAAAARLKASARARCTASFATVLACVQHLVKKSIENVSLSVLLPNIFQAFEEADSL
jgi:hypothetical protein